MGKRQEEGWKRLGWETVAEVQLDDRVALEFGEILLSDDTLEGLLRRQATAHCILERSAKRLCLINQRESEYKNMLD